MSWLKKMMNYFFDDEEDMEEPEEREKAPKNVQTRQAADNASKHTADSTKSSKIKNAGSGPKMLSDYPAPGNFRFPVIPDEPRPETERRINPQAEHRAPASKPVRVDNISRTVRSKERTVERNIERRQDDTRKERTPRKREKFRPEPVPSPIYGLNPVNRNDLNPVNRTDAPEKKLHNKQNIETTNSEVTPKFVPTDIPSPVYGFKERNKEKIIFPGWSFKDEQKKEDPQMINEDNAEENQNEADGVVYHESQDQDSILDERVELLPAASEEILFDAEPEEQNESELTRADHDGPAFAVSEPPAEEKEEPLAAEASETAEEQPSAIITPSVTAGGDTKERKTEPPMKKPGGTYVPFNVMMLKKDRQAIKERAAAPAPKAVPQPAVKPAEMAPSVKPAQEKKSHLIPIEFLDVAPAAQLDDESWLLSQESLLQETLNNFNVNAKVVHLTQGPSVTRFEVQPAPGVKVNKITNLTDDIKLSLSARDIRIEAPIPGKNTIGIEVPNRVSRAVYLREIIEDPAFSASGSPLTVALGLDISGSPVVTDLQKMPHGLIAGATGSGKSVCINSILVSLLYKSSPEDVRLLLVDPKMVELAPYNHIPHLVTPVINDAKEATAALKWAVEEMERRYEDFARTGVRDIKRFNDKMTAEKHYANKMPYIVIVIDELADLMMVSPQDVEEAICRIAQKARACGIHLLLATQRPSVDVITGLIKANIPTRAAFAVSSAIDSRTILDMSGAERLLGRGDMLFMENGSNKAVRIQGNFVSDDEIEAVTTYVKEEYPLNYLFSREELIQTQQHIDQEDDLFEEACYYVMDVGAASSSSLQRRFRVGFNRAARLIEMMEAFGLVSEAMGSKPRNVLLTPEEFEERLYADV
ncbi:DNA translocase FtsK [Fictibacillus aquaticus]|uniref:Cell division protein FtsK n=1 Tax=Fictibacillus aquaticus TaxID=2021314 RepID=A0A235FAB6_9BACL|nr:DNA translocase FtsK [Fictibacillus aquaticus]OYD58238.1 cell division protein FtsK [Fictibacillus aquaticus]